MSENHKKVGIAGAGIVGVCTALMLQRRGFKVTLIDPNPPGEGASFGNAGCFNGSAVVRVAPGANPPATALTEIYNVPALAQPAAAPSSSRPIARPSSARCGSPFWSFAIART